MPVFDLPSEATSRSFDRERLPNDSLIKEHDVRDVSLDFYQSEITNTQSNTNAGSCVMDVTCGAVRSESKSNITSLTGSSQSFYYPDYDVPLPPSSVPADYVRLLSAAIDRKPSVFDREGETCSSPKSVNAATGEIVRCGKSTCVYCLLVDAGRIAGAIQLSAPTHIFALTWVGRTEQEIKCSVRRWLRALRSVYRTQRPDLLVC